MATHSSTLAWKIPWMEEPGRLQSIGLLWVGHDWVASLSLFTFLALEKEMATHSSILSWRIPGTGETGGLLSMGSHRVGHDWSNLAAAAAAIVIFRCYNNWCCLCSDGKKNLPVMQETQIWSLDWEDLLEKVMATHCGILAWRTPWIDYEVSKNQTQLSNWHFQ